MTNDNTTYTSAAQDAHTFLKVHEVPKTDPRWQTMMFWRGIITLSEYEAATGITDHGAAIAALDADVQAWLAS